ncbi:hypothetical protein GCM10008094_23140 [Aidingimonas halophila]|nr:hypothetical protein GCM10008094_23140 [Aidingimonas halophila]
MPAPSEKIIENHEDTIKSTQSNGTGRHQASAVCLCTKPGCTESESPYAPTMCKRGKGARETAKRAGPQSSPFVQQQEIAIDTR